MAKISLWIQERESQATSNGNSQSVILPLEEKATDAESAKYAVYSNGSYRLFLTFPVEMVDDCHNWRLWLNDNALDSVPHWNAEQKCAEVPCEDRPFKELLAFAQFSLKLDQSASATLYSPPVHVLLDNKEESQLIQKIGDYVTEHAQGILVNRKEPRITFTKGTSANPPDFAEVIAFLRNIVQTYQFDTDYFRSNSRSRIKIEGRVDAIERLRYFTPETLRFISMHPEELVPASGSTGIRYGGLSFEPVRTWIQGDKVDRNVYENQIVLGFLSTVINHTENLINQTGIRVAFLADAEEEKENGESANLIQRTSKKKLQEIGTALLQLNDRLRRLFILYKEFMEAVPAKITRVPEPTAVFQSIPAYNRIYNLLHRWFTLREVSFEKNSFFMDAWRTSRAYEYYCLIRLIEELKEKGFVLENQVEYPWKNASEVLQKDKINNIYFLKRGETKITVYYEPVISCKIQRESGLLLFKNSTGYLNEYSTGLRFDQGTLQSRYTPDYVIKYENKNTTKYLIADAKFSKPNEVVALELITLLLKYRILISPARKNDIISGLSIFCGKKANGYVPLPLFNVENPITHHFFKSSLNINQIMPESSDALLPPGFLDL